jgi:hypothetical protein
VKPLRDAMRHEAGRTWREKARAGRFGLFLNEETITELILLNLATACQGHGLFVRPFSKTQEKKTGADWEFWFIQGTRAVGLRVQAKRLFPSGDYSSLKPGGAQMTQLTSNAGNCCPVYVFYNDAVAYRWSKPICACSEYRAPSYLGCNVAAAAVIAHAATNSAASLQSVVIPWHCLLCDGASAKNPMPATVAGNLNKHIGDSDGSRCEVVETPRQFTAYLRFERFAGSESVLPEGLEAYLSERTLAGIALIGSALEVE